MSILLIHFGFVVNRNVARKVSYIIIMCKYCHYNELVHIDVNLNSAQDKHIFMLLFYELH